MLGAEASESPMGSSSYLGRALGGRDLTSCVPWTLCAFAFMGLFANECLGSLKIMAGCKRTAWTGAGPAALVGCVPAAWELAGGPEEGGGISVWGRESRGEPQRSPRPQPLCDLWVKLRTAQESAGALRLHGKVLEASPCHGGQEVGMAAWRWTLLCPCCLGNAGDRNLSFRQFMTSFLKLINLIF